VKLRSLSSRIALMLAMAVTLILGGSALLIDHLIDAELASRFDDTMLSQARAIAALVEVNARQPDLEDLQRMPSRLLLGDTDAAYRVQCAGGYHIDRVPATLHYPAQWLEQAGERPRYANLESSGRELRAVWFRFHPGQDNDHADADQPACTLLLLQPASELDEILFTLDAILLIIPLLALVAVIGLTPALVRRGLRPLADLGERMRGIGPAAPEQRLPAGEVRELAPLVERFNEVLERMQEGMQRERRFAGALAHETRTRLAELRALVDVEIRHPSDRPRTEVLAEIGVIGGELEDTVTGLLLLTRLEAGIESIQWQAFDLDAAIDKQLAAVAELTGRRRIAIERVPPARPLQLVGDVSVFGIVLGNLLRNAAAYAPRGSRIHLAWDEAGLRLDNDAPELAAADVAQFGSRYWRKSARDTGGAHAGLGLSLAAASATALGLELRFELGAEKRLAAILAWPKERVVESD